VNDAGSSIKLAFKSKWIMLWSKFPRASLLSTNMALNHDGQVSALISLIVNAGKALEQQFAKSTKPFVPSLDDTESHPLDSEIFDKELRTTIQVIEAACFQLSATAGRPSHTLVKVGHRRLVDPTHNTNLVKI